MTLLENSQENDVKFNRILDAYSKKLFSQAKRYYPQSIDDAEDLYQDTLIQLYNHVEEIIEDNFINYAFRVMYRLFLDKTRYNARRITAVSFEEWSATDDYAKFGFEDSKHAHDKTVDIESEVMLNMVNDMNSKQLRSLIATLQLPYRETLSYRTYGVSNPVNIYNNIADGMEYSDISKNLKIPINTVRSRISRATSALSSMIKENDYRYYS